MVANQGHTLTGIIGTRFLFEVLSRYGHPDVALAILLNDTYPSYGYMVQGPTNPEPSATLWELWDGDTGSPVMSSRNHLMFASVSTWFYRWLAGLRSLQAGWGRVLVAPAVTNNSNVPFLSAYIDTPRGRIAVAWSPGAARQTTCGEAAEAAAPGINSVVLSCGNSRIASVLFASFGTPEGHCPTFTVGSCNAASSTAIVAGLCLNKTNCTIPVTDAVFGDPCEGVKKSLAVSVACDPPALQAYFSTTVSLPVGVTALVAVPLPHASDEVEVSTNGVVVWQAGQFVPGAPGVLGASQSAGTTGYSNSTGPAILVDVVSGVFIFEASLTTRHV